MAEAFEFRAQFEVIVDFAIEDDCRAGFFVADRLVAAGEVDNFQASCAHRTLRGLEDTLLVRTAVENRRDGFLYAIGLGSPIFVSEACNSAQVLTPLNGQQGR